MSMMPVYCSGCGELLVHCKCAANAVELINSISRWKKQDIFYIKDVQQGNCMQACVASLFNVPMGEVPSFAADKQWFKAFRGFIRSKGYEPMSRFKERDSDIHVPSGLHLVSGKSSRGCEHMVIYKNGTLFHDPHPSNEGISEVLELTMLIPLDPASFTKIGDGASNAG